MSDLEIIKQLEKQLGKRLTQIESNEFGGDTQFVLEDDKVTGLNLFQSKLSRIPEIILKLRHLTHLSFNSNQISDLSLLKKLTKLTHLHLSSNLISDLSPLKKIAQLNTLHLADNKISDISFLKELTQLSHLYLGSNHLSSVFISPLKKSTQLNTLDLSYNNLTNILPLKELTQLTTLMLYNNHLADIAPLEKLTQLIKLELRYNQISDISPLKKLTRLTHLDLLFNQISDLSPLKKLNQLTQLYLRSNQISDLSPLMALSNLKWLDLENNKIKHLPADIAQLEIKWSWGLGGLSLKNNPLGHPPLEIVQKGREAVREYFEEFAKAHKPLNEVKVLLVGEGAAGKTSLVKRILGEGFDKDESQTDGINIDSWKIKWKNKDIKVHLWDFGGQEIMHATHQFFLSKRSLYILVLDGRKDDKTEYWLKLIESVGGDSPVLVVINKIDQNPGFEVNQKTLRRKYKNIKGFYRLSCATGKGVKEFIPSLKEQLAEVEMIHTTWPGSWFNIKTALEEMKEDFIPYERYKEICAGESITDSLGQETLVEFLNDLGIILHFKDLELQDTNVLNPEWVTEGVYKIVNSAELAKGKGILESGKLDGILKKRAGDRFDYPHGKCRYIVELMKKFELCFGLGQGRILVPDLLKVEESEFELDFKNALSFQLDYDFLPRSVMPRFMVRMHNDIKGELRWRTGVVLENKDFHATALVTVDHEEKKFYIFVTGERKRDYFSVIRHTIREINDSFEKLEVAEKVPLPDSDKVTVDYEELTGLERMGTKEFDVGKLGKRFSVALLLDGIEKPEARKKEMEHAPLKQDIVFSPVMIQDSTQIQKQETTVSIDIDIDISVELPALQFDFSELKELLEERDPKLEKQLEKIEDGLDILTGRSSPQELAPPLNKMGRFLLKAVEPDSKLNKILTGTKKGIETAQMVGRTYNKFAQWLALPQVPDAFLGKDDQVDM
jgi:small GTP-binding protein